MLEEDGVTLLEVDVNISKSYNLREPAPVYRALLWAAMRGQVHGVLGGPPRGEGTGDLVLKQMFVWMIAAQAAESYEIAAPGFAMCMPTRSDLWESSVWKSFQSSYNVNLIKGKPEVSLVTTLSFSATDVLWEKPAASGTLVWTPEFKLELIEANDGASQGNVQGRAGQVDSTCSRRPRSFSPSVSNLCGRASQGACSPTHRGPFMSHHVFGRLWTFQSERAYSGSDGPEVYAGSLLCNSKIEGEQWRP